MPSSVTLAVIVTGVPARGRAIGSMRTTGGASFAISSLLTCTPPLFVPSTLRSISKVSRSGEARRRYPQSAINPQSPNPPSANPQSPISPQSAIRNPHCLLGLEARRGVRRSLRARRLARVELGLVLLVGEVVPRDPREAHFV